MEFAYRTDIGRRRPNNQDYVGIFKNQSEATLALVADGMGGHRGGDVASEMAVSHLGYAFEKPTLPRLSPSSAGLFLSCSRKMT